MASAKKLIKLFYNSTGQLELEQVNLACKYLKNNGVVILPTDTLYGLAARIDDDEALERIYKIKGRHRDKPLAVCVSDIDQINQVADTSKIEKHIFKSLLPGPITLVLNRSIDLNKNLNPGIDTIGVRIPDHNFIMAVSNIVGPLALTSANLSGEQDPVAPQHFESVIDDVDIAFDNGLLKNYLEYGNPDVVLRLGSTVVDLTEPKRFKIIRQGCALDRTINLLQKFGYRPAKDK